jgi:hypothetical protein
MDTTSIDTTALASDVPPFAPFFHPGTGALRFWVRQDDGQYIGASISKETLHYCFKGERNGDNAMATYEANRLRIDSAVRRRVATGAREPVMLRDADVQAAQEPGPGA